MLMKLVFASAVGYGLYRYFNPNAGLAMQRAAFADGESTPGTVEVRNAGPDAMASDMKKWDAVDQASDESYPASDPPATNRFT